MVTLCDTAYTICLSASLGGILLRLLFQSLSFCIVVTFFPHYSSSSRIPSGLSSSTSLSGIILSSFCTRSGALFVDLYPLPERRIVNLDLRPERGVIVDLYLHPKRAINVDFDICPKRRFIVLDPCLERRIIVDLSSSGISIRLRFLLYPHLLKKHFVVDVSLST